MDTTIVSLNKIKKKTCCQMQQNNGEKALKSGNLC